MRGRSDYSFSGEVTETTQEERTRGTTGVPTEKLREEKRVPQKANSQASEVMEIFPEV